MEHASEFRRCLLEMDVTAIRRLWRHVSPELPQPTTDDEVITTMHLARVAMTTLPEEKRAYSQAWLDERKTAKVAAAVGIVVIAPERRRAQAIYIREAMEDAVLQAQHAGLDLDLDAAEVRRRMMLARERA